MGRIDERLRRLDEALPRPEPTIRQLIKTVHEDFDGAAQDVTVEEGGQVLFEFKAGTPQEAKFEAFLASGGPWAILTVRVVHTPPLPPEPVSCGMEDADVLEASLRKQGELRAELKRLQARRAELLIEGGMKDESVN